MHLKRIIIMCSKNILLRNVNKTNFQSRCLLIYVTKPFVKKYGKVSHPNYYKALIISQCLKELGYNVDVIYSEYTRKLNLKKYNLIIGMGEGYTNTYNRINADCKRIYLATGTCFTVANQRELERWIALSQKNRGFVGINRFELMKDPVKTILSMYKSDAIISGGDNEWVISSYKWINKKIYSVGSIALTGFRRDEIKRKLIDCRRNVMFLCGSGCIHKGLDIIVEAFSKKKDYTLYIIGNIEDAFKNAYEEELRQKNIVLVNFIDVTSTKFKRFCSKCGFIINMSCSESCCTSVLTGMLTGLIPIITEAEGINIEDCGYLLKKADCEEIEKTLDLISHMSEDKLEYQSERAAQIVEKNYSSTSYYAKFKAALEDILFKG